MSEDEAHRSASPASSYHALRPLVWGGSIAALAVAYYFAIALPSYNRAQLELANQKYSEELKRADDARVEVTGRQIALDSCIAAANEARIEFVRLNASAKKGATITAPTSVFATADKRLNDERDACMKRFPAR